jgi:hypothetical protein
MLLTQPIICCGGSVAANNINRLDSTAEMWDNCFEE